MSSPTHYKVKAKAIKRILDSPTIVIMSVEGVHLEPTLESVGGQCAGDGAGEEGEERRQHQSRHPAHSLQIYGKLFWVYMYKSLKDLPLSEI